MIGPGHRLPATRADHHKSPHSQVYIGPSFHLVILQITPFLSLSGCVTPSIIFMKGVLVLSPSTSCSPDMDYKPSSLLHNERRQLVVLWKEDPLWCCSLLVTGTLNFWQDQLVLSELAEHTVGLGREKRKPMATCSHVCRCSTACKLYAFLYPQ